MISQKTKSIFLICSGYFLWVFLDLLVWLQNNTDQISLIVNHNISRLVYGTVLCAVFVLLQWKINSRFSSNRFLLISVITATALIFAVILAYLNVVVSAFWLTDVFDLRPNRTYWYAFFNSTVLFLALTGLFYVDFFYRISSQQREQLLRTKALADEAHLLMLRYQINPHFLFNALNAIQSMIEKDKTRAKDMVADLSDFFRYTLSKNNQTLVPLEEEIEAVKKYLAIQKERFAGKLHVEYEIDNASLKTMLPFFIIHPLVENAIKYGFQTNDDILNVIIKVRRKDQTLNILVKNSGHLVSSQQIKEKDLSSTGTGIDNIKKRLSIFYPDSSSFELFEKDGFVHALISISHKSVSL